MTDERGDSDDGPTRADHSESDNRSDRGGRDEPLGDLAAAVRERTGDRPPAERPEAAEREGPLADVASAVDERRRKRRESGDGADAFESVEVGELDGEKLWEELADEGGDTQTVPLPADATDLAAETEAEEQTDAPDRDVRTIPKATCHSCPHFGDPPELACTRDETDILAMPDTDHFRVADCPIVVDGEEDISGIGVESDAGDDAEE